MTRRGWLVAVIVTVWLAFTLWFIWSAGQYERSL